MLSAFTHLWNAGGFPGFHMDEGHYMRRALHTLEGNGVQEEISPYDHPYFGQIFMASVFKVIGYPDSLNPKPGDPQSIEMIYLVPRVLMGVLAVVDTFLVYKIAERRYGRNVAIVASVLFAVMPLGWILRRIMLDSILLPFLLSSILLAVYGHGGNRGNSNGGDNTDKNAAKANGIAKANGTKVKAMAKVYVNGSVLLPLLSGVFLGLAIFTKIPAFTMIPLVGILIYKNTKSFRTLALWFLPVILIPAIWPAYAVSVGEFDQWVDGVLWQGTERNTDVDNTLSLYHFLRIFFNIDPLLFALGIAGLAFAAIRRDFFTLLWVIPYLTLVFVVGKSNHFHWALALPAFCIAGAVLIEYVSSRISFRIKRRKLLQNLPLFAITSVIGIFGLVVTTMLITTNLSMLQVNATTLLSEYLIDKPHTTTILGAAYSWIPKYVFNNDNVFADYTQMFGERTIKTDNITILANKDFKDYFFNSGESTEESIEPTPEAVIDNDPDTLWYFENSTRILQLNLNTNQMLCGIQIAWFEGQQDSNEERLGMFLEEEIPNKFTVSYSKDGRSFDDWYTNSTNASIHYFQKYDFSDVLAQHLRVTINGNLNDKSIGISEISVYGQQNNSESSSACKSLDINNVRALTLEDTYPPSQMFAGKGSYSEKISTLYYNTNTVTYLNGTSTGLNKTMPYAGGEEFVEIRSNY